MIRKEFIVFKHLNIIESQAQLIEEQQKQNQSLKDEINRLKGEKGKPKFLPKVPEKINDPLDPSTNKKKNWTKSAKKPSPTFKRWHKKDKNS
jgi:hypothetical protein